MGFWQYMTQTNNNYANEFLAKLDKINWTSTEGDKTLFGEALGHEWKLVLRFRLCSSSTKEMFYEMPVQATFSLLMDGVHATTFGSEDNEMNAQLCEWMVKAISATMTKSIRAEDMLRNTAKAMLDTLA